MQELTLREYRLEGFERYRLLSSVAVARPVRCIGHFECYPLFATDSHFWIVLGCLWQDFPDAAQIHTHPAGRPRRDKRKLPSESSSLGSCMGSADIRSWRVLTTFAVHLRAQRYELVTGIVDCLKVNWPSWISFQFLPQIRNGVIDASPGSASSPRPDCPNKLLS